MTKKELKKFDIVKAIYNELFGIGNRRQLESELNMDIGYHGVVRDLTQTSCNLDFKVSTFQSRSENIYFNVSLFDYDTKETTDAGYFYIKNYTGEISENELKALYHIMITGNKITEKIFEAV